MPAYVPVTAHQARTAIMRHLGGPTDRCRKLAPTAVSCRNITPDGVIVSSEGEPDRYVDLVMRVTARKRANGRWEFSPGDNVPLPPGLHDHDAPPGSTREAGDKA